MTTQGATPPPHPPAPSATYSKPGSVRVSESTGRRGWAKTRASAAADLVELAGADADGWVEVGYLVRVGRGR